MMTYACESWMLREREKARLQACNLNECPEEGSRSD